MPKSRKRPAAVKKIKRLRKKEERYKFLMSPWSSWRTMAAEGDEVSVAILEHVPFFTHGGSFKSLAAIAEGEGMPVAQVVESLANLEARGAVAWDEPSQTVVICQQPPGPVTFPRLVALPAL